MAPVTFRAPERADLHPILGLLTACDKAEVGHPDNDEEDVLWRWRLDGFSVERDAVVAEVDGTVAAYALVFEGLADVWVHPHMTGRGIGTCLVKAVEARAIDRADSPDGYLRQNFNGVNTASRHLLESHGYAPSHHYARMVINLEGPVAVPEPPPGIEIRSLRVGQDERATYECMQTAWAQYETWQPQSFERWTAEYLEGDDFDPGQWSLALDGDKVLALAIGLNYPGEGWLQILGTIPEARGRGLGELLLKRTFSTYQRRGLNRVGLTVSSRNMPAAKRLYERAGMREIYRYENYMKPLPAPKGNG